MKRLLIAISMAAVAMLALSSPASADGSVTCTESISGTVDANVVVPDGAICAVVPPATINGNVSVGRGANVIVSEGVTINGNLDADSESVVLVGPNVTLNGNYSAFRATSGILESTVALNVSFTDGFYAALGKVIGNLSCSGGATGAISTTIGGGGAGCTIGTLETVLEDLGVAAGKVNTSSGGKPLPCKFASGLASMYFGAGNAAKAAGLFDIGAAFQGIGCGVLQGAGCPSNCFVTP